MRTVNKREKREERRRRVSLHAKEEEKRRYERQGVGQKEVEETLQVGSSLSVIESLPTISPEVNEKEERGTKKKSENDEKIPCRQVYHRSEA